MQDEIEVVAREIIAYAMDDSQCWDSANQKWIIYRSKLLQWGAALESAALRQRPVVDNDAYCDNVLDPLWHNYGEDSVQYQTALAAYRQMRQRPVVDDEALIGAIARAWCWKENEDKIVDPILGAAIAKEVKAILAAYQQDNGGQQG